jgi:hypothetical protein
MNATTHSGTISARPHAAFDFISRAENLPKWAPGFAQSVAPEGDHWIAKNATGEVRFALRCNAESGTVDFLAVLGPEKFLLTAPTRIVANGCGASEYIFTLFQLPGEKDEAFAMRQSALKAEFCTLDRLLAESPAHCV